MKQFLAKLAGFAAAFAAIIILNQASGMDPVWYLLGLWLWRDLSDTMEKEDRT